MDPSPRAPLGGPLVLLTLLGRGAGVKRNHRPRLWGGAFGRRQSRPPPLNPSSKDLRRSASVPADRQAVLWLALSERQTFHLPSSTTRINELTSRGLPSSHRSKVRYSQTAGHLDANSGSDTTPGEHEDAGGPAGRSTKRPNTAPPFWTIETEYRASPGPRRHRRRS